MNREEISIRYGRAISGLAFIIAFLAAIVAFAGIAMIFDAQSDGWGLVAGSVGVWSAALAVYVIWGDS